MGSADSKQVQSFIAIYRNNGSEMLTFIKSVDYIKEPSLKEIPLRQFIEQINEVFTIASRK